MANNISKLKDYTSGKIHFTPIMNIMMNERTKDWYAELGKYITTKLDIETRDGSILRRKIFVEYFGLEPFWIHFQILEIMSFLRKTKGLV
jgi:hypothetical protein